MRDKKLHTPDGVMDILPEEYAHKKEIENRIESVFHRYGYKAVQTPAFEYMEVFTGIGSIKPGQMYKFIDRDGEILTLRSDITPQIARITATNDWGEPPLRFCYVANAFRYNENYQGKLREFTQAGAELTGVSSDEANAEILAVAINSLLAAGLSDVRIDIGHVEFLSGVLEESGLSPSDLEAVQTHILNRDYVAVESIVHNKSMPSGVKKILSNLAFYIGDINLLLKCEAEVESETAKNALTRLKNIYTILKSYRLEKYVLFDLSLLGHLTYYTGMIFRGYTYGTGFSIAEGGQCDRLIGRFGKEMPSVGFAIRINDLTAAISNQNLNITPARADTLVAYTQAGRDLAMACADELRDTGMYIENSLLGEDVNVNIEYAKKKNIGGIIYFKDESQIVLINIETGQQTETTYQELLGRCEA